MRRLSFIGIVAAVIMQLCGCSANNCPLESSVFCNYGFYDSEGKAISYNDAITISIRIPSSGKDSIIINQLSGASSLKIPMSYFYKTDTLIMSYASLVRNDTIIVSHESYAHVDLPECGTKYFHELKGIWSSSTGIDKIEIVNPVVDYQGWENIKIYFNGVAG